MRRSKDKNYRSYTIMLIQIIIFQIQIFMDVKIGYMLIFIQILIKKIIITCSVILSSMPKKLYGDNFSTAAAGKSLLISSQRRKESRLVIEREDEARMPF